MSISLSRYKDVPLVSELFSIEEAAGKLSTSLQSVKNALAQKGLYHPKFIKQHDDTYKVEARDNMGRFIGQDAIKSAFLGAEETLKNPVPAAVADPADEGDKIRAARKAEEDAAADANTAENVEEEAGVAADLPAGDAPANEDDKDKKKKTPALPELPNAYIGFLTQMVQFGAKSPEDVHQMLGDDFISRLKDDGRGIEFHGDKMKIHYQDGGHIEIEPVNGRLFITLHGKKMDEQSARDIVRLQKARGANVIDVNGPKAAKQLLWRAAQEEGLNVSTSSYKPSSDDLEWLADMEAMNNFQKQEQILAGVEGLGDLVKNTQIQTLETFPTLSAEDQQKLGEANWKFMNSIGYELRDNGLTTIDETSLRADAEQVRDMQAILDNNGHSAETLEQMARVINPEGKTFGMHPADAFKNAPAPETPKAAETGQKDFGFLEDTRPEKDELLLDSRYELKNEAPKSRFGTLIGNAAKNARNDVKNASQFLGGLKRKIGLGAKPVETPALDTPAQQVSKPALKPPGR